MNTQEVQKLLVFTNGERKGLFGLFLLIILLQILYFSYHFWWTQPAPPQDAHWLSVKLEALPNGGTDFKTKVIIYPFNPNFLTDYKGYKFGMTTTEIDRLFAFRKQNKFVNSAAEFQQVTKVSDAVLNQMKPYFKFPDWVNQSTSKNFDQTKYSKNKDVNVVIKDLNGATKADLMEVYGIGDAISDRILNEKAKFGCFVSMEQLSYIWGISPEVVQKMKQQFKITTTTSAIKININMASVKELSQFPYFNYSISKDIVKYRTMNGDFKNIDDLSKINGISVDKLKIIAVYLEF
ncbi:hypothetical protein B0A58_02260 [Flavobacterium branchiophilum NBRC 15030 = ATCC 35035]|uniref:DNA uptake protein ComE-like DNA-binding protein n=1 Tax=Flavobacterium branchiophilum TaxID=55197 RepID=A0A543G5Y5_9FLAO|nr:helix-hairpin-helix domain-containing protein [Flavobacterium branchiophilum]OXA80646.1 hypothetical protein B0A58_02260 [Flavobacterium branchiophilum NBRC 15030 = ATCC 35035]TQM41482.1 DNA uptake protein ComE-like DNA-binding protein [Flavobacterium branchiophilum]GEM54183.1 hypothetical protein FB1_04040 [Flavobacterium branchiophilum NBRC 15030 = ATCC 35035]